MSLISSSSLASSLSSSSWPSRCLVRSLLGKKIQLGLYSFDCFYAIVLILFFRCVTVKTSNSNTATTHLRDECSPSFFFDTKADGTYLSFLFYLILSLSIPFHLSHSIVFISILFFFTWAATKEVRTANPSVTLGLRGWYRKPPYPRW